MKNRQKKPLQPGDLPEQNRPGEQPDEDLRLNPEARLCPAFDSTSIKTFAPPSQEMGLRVIDNCAEENIK